MSQNYYYDHGKYPYTNQNYSQEELNAMLLDLIKKGDEGGLPEVTAADNGKVLKVADGVWGKGTIDVPVATDTDLPVYIAALRDPEDISQGYISSQSPIFTIPCNSTGALGDLFEYNSLFTNKISSNSLIKYAFNFLADICIRIYRDGYHMNIPVGEQWYYTWTLFSDVGDDSKATTADTLIEGTDQLYILVDISRIV